MRRRQLRVEGRLDVLAFRTGVEGTYFISNNVPGMVLNVRSKRPITVDESGDSVDIIRYELPAEK